MRYLVLAALLVGFFIGNFFAEKRLPQNNKEKSAETQSFFLEAVEWSALKGFEEDNAAQVFPALLRSCEKLLQKDPNTPFGADLRFGFVSDWAPFCGEVGRKALQVDVNEVNIHSLLKEYLQPFQIKEEKSFFSMLGFGHLWAKEEGLFTGYYAPLLEGSFEKKGPYQTPLHTRPKDLISVRWADFSEKRQQGKILRGRVVEGWFKPYFTREEINQGAFEEENILLWLKDPIEKFFLQVQGSGRVQLPDGRTVYVGYDGANGHPYTAIGRYMAEKGYLKLEDVSLESIYAWLKNHPEKQTEVLHQNKSYVFFKLAEDGPYGSQQVLLTPGRSLAVDSAAIPLGTPLFVTTTQTLDSQPFRRFMVAQDTGGAIKGPIRGDIYFGDGIAARALAGAQKEKGALFVLLPRGISVTQVEGNE